MLTEREKEVLRRATIVNGERVVHHVDIHPDYVNELASLHRKGVLRVGRTVKSLNTWVMVDSIIVATVKEEEYAN
jgi:hypothetical protein